jgi:hypothetical protein
MRSFAQELNWVPSYEVQGNFGIKSVAGHLIVEHGLENAAAISFLKSPFRSAQLGPEQLKDLLAVSYNNLIEWHLFISESDARWVNNLVDRTATPGADNIVSLDPGDLLRVVSSSRLDELDRGGRLRKSIKSCDDALLQIISRWKLLLKADYPEVENRNLSALFNALIFVRGCEDRNLDNTPGATRVLLASLSLALLHLIATGNLPKAGDLRVTNADAIASIMNGTLKSHSYGAVMSNPPYVKLDHLPAEDRAIFSQYLGDEHSGRMDAYIPFVQLCLELSQPRGIVCLVLPQTFMTAANASALRTKISLEFDVRCLVDLSAVPVFESVGAYTTLLVLQRRIVVPGLDRPPAQIAQVTESVGAALQACIDGREVKNQLFSVFPAAQAIFRSKAWVLVSPEQIRIDQRLSGPARRGFSNLVRDYGNGRSHFQKAR